GRKRSTTSWLPREAAAMPATGHDQSIVTWKTVVVVALTGRTVTVVIGPAPPPLASPTVPPGLAPTTSTSPTAHVIAAPAEVAAALQAMEVGTTRIVPGT